MFFAEISLVQHSADITTKTFGFSFSKKKKMDKKCSANEKFLLMVLHIMLLMQYVSKILIFLYAERMLHCMAKAPISQQNQDTVISIQNLIPKIITTFLLLKFWLEDMQW